MENGNWKLETGESKLEISLESQFHTTGLTFDIPVSNFYFPIPIPR